MRSLIFLLLSIVTSASLGAAQETPGPTNSNAEKFAIELTSSSAAKH